MKEKTTWECNASYVEDVCGGYIDWDERFYECPDCGEPIYECDWDEVTLNTFLCPVCELTYDDLEEEEEKE